MIGLVGIICINPSNQNPKIKENIQHIVNGILSLVKNVKLKSSSSVNQDLYNEEEEEIDDEKLQKVHILTKSLLVG